MARALLPAPLWYNAGMETIIRHVRDIESDERRVLEHVIGRQLQANQQVIIQVVTLGGQPVEEATEQNAPPDKLPEWCNVYGGLTEREITEVEETILQRSDLTSPFVATPPMSLCLLDTDALSEVLRAEAPRRRAEGERVPRPVPAVGFLVGDGATRSCAASRPRGRSVSCKALRRSVSTRSSSPSPTPSSTVRRDLWATARTAGLPRNDADLIIAATALEHGRHLVTGNAAHFSWIPHLIIEDWRQP